MSAAASPLRVGERFTRRATFDADSIRRFATMCGDHGFAFRFVKAVTTGVDDGGSVYVTATGRNLVRPRTAGL
jgi:hypothetical protein